MGEITNKIFIERAKKVHGDKYDYKNVEYVSKRIHVKIICPIHGEFKIEPRYHTSRGYGCKKCKKELDLNNNYKIFLENAIKFHNNKYDYSLSNYTGSKNKIEIICPIHGVFKQTPDSHLSKDCLKCSIEKNAKNRILDNDEFIKKAKVKHKNKYDYSLVSYKKYNIKVKIICPKHGVFEQYPNAHSAGKGCFKCGRKSISEANRITTSELIKRAKIKHKNKYNYSLVNFVSSDIKVKIICKKHGEFLQLAHSHINGSGCPVCKESHGETNIREWLNENNINFKAQKKFNHCKYKRKLPFDFYLPDYNTCIEYNGIQHYKTVKNNFFGGHEELIKRIERDNIKKDFCKKNNIELLIIKYNQSVDDILSDRFN